MATATSVLSAGAIPSLSTSTKSDDRSSAVEAAIGPCTKAVVPVHMWGTACNMDAIMEIARRATLSSSRMRARALAEATMPQVCSIGHIGCFSFNYYKNMTCGEAAAWR